MTLEPLLNRRVNGTMTTPELKGQNFSEEKKLQQGHKRKERSGLEVRRAEERKEKVNLFYCKQMKIANPNPFIFYIVKLTKISNANCLDETTIHVDMILYLSLYYLVNDLVHFPYPTIRNVGLLRIFQFTNKRSVPRIRHLNLSDEVEEIVIGKGKFEL
ncbi:hypothetical protein MTR_7g026940 [Medicago truncatula]|uniref:Uncharacterized protein n=1 Tax=Medicago truncatula TaxID=3880 RepID=G7L143_MEDTR|nr:hypothetical protein MTR_7g026940 [Medicago truncatula]